MTFENPQGLWLLVLGAPIVAAHFAHGRLRKMSVPTLVFWEQAAGDEDPRPALRRLRHYASLAIHLGLLLLLTSAVALPRWGARPARYVLILDATASMQAVEPDGRTRLDAAVDHAREFVKTRAHGDEASALDLDIPFTSDLEGLALRLTAPRLVRSLALRDRVLADAVAILFTDRTPAGVDDLIQSGRLRVVLVGTPRDNVGYVAGSSVCRPGENRMEISLGVANCSAAAAERAEVLMWNDRELARRPLKLIPGERKEVAWTLDPARFKGAGIEAGGLAEIVLEPHDALSADDTASFVVPPLAPPPVVVFSPDHPDAFLMHALHALQEDGLAGAPYEASTSQFGSALEKLGDGTIAVFDRCFPPRLPDRGAFLILGASGEQAVDRPKVLDWDRDAPPNEQADYADVLVRRAQMLKGKPLIWSSSGSLAVWSSRGGRAIVAFGFALEDSDFHLRPAFLTMLYNFVRWASFSGVRAFPPQCAAGEPIVAARPLWIEEGELMFSYPDRLERAAVKGGWPLLAPRAAAGFVRAGAGGRSEWIAGNVFDAAESDLRVPETPAPGLPLPPAAPWPARISFRTLAAVLALVLVLAEGWLFHRGLI